jgi:hypothetical protein
MRSIQLTDIQDEDEMEMSDDERDSSRPPYSKRTRYDNDKLKVIHSIMVCWKQLLNESFFCCVVGRQ